MAKVYNLHGYAGLIQQRPNRMTGTLIGIYQNEQAGMCCGCSRGPNTSLGDGHDPQFHNPYSTVCEEHGQLVAHRTLELARAHAACPEWCEACLKIMEEKGIF